MSGGNTFVNNNNGGAGTREVEELLEQLLMQALHQGLMVEAGNLA
jgi:hypothetical protein